MNRLIISDPQIPFQHPDCIPFIKRVKKEFNIPDEGMCCVGDELDNYFGGLWKKSPEAAHTPNSEIRASLDILTEWYCEFPQMKLATSNHGTRWQRKAAEAEIPSQLLRQYREVINAPEGWQWAKRWQFNDGHPWLLEHGDDWGGGDPHVQATLYNGISTAIGHYHSKASVTYLNTGLKQMWAMVTGSIIDFDQYAFEYARKSKLKPVISLGVVVDNGRVAFLIPY